MTALYADDEILVGHVILEPGERLPAGGEEVHAQQSETIFMLHGSVRVCTPLGAEIVTGGHRVLNQSFVAETIEHHVENASASEPAMYVAFLRRVEDPPQTSARALTENDFRVRVQAGEWPAILKHAVKNRLYDYDHVLVYWRACEDPVTYRLGEDNNGCGDSSALAKANRILALKAKGHDVSPRSP